MTETAAVQASPELSQNKAPDAPVFLKSKDLGSDDFLKLLTVQLTNQDPWNPIENTDFIAQMASFTSLANSSEQLKIGNNHLDVLKDIKQMLQTQNKQLQGFIKSQASSNKV